MAATETSRDAAGSAASYRSALRASSITALSSVLVLALRLVRTKFAAVLLGPAGIGLLGTLSTFLNTVQTVADLGTRGSAVRQIAMASEAGDLERTARVSKSLGLLTMALGVIGALVVVALAEPISRLAFGDGSMGTAIAVLSLAVLFSCINNGQRVLLRGMRRIADLARADVWAAALGTAVTLPILWLGGLQGIAPALVAAAVVSVGVGAWYAHKVRLPQVAIERRAIGADLRAMLGLGLVFLVTGVLATGVQFALRAILVRQDGLEVAGEYQAAATIAFVYVGFLLQAMGQDFYPRLNGLLDRPEALNRLTNEQLELSMLLAGPGLVVTILLSGWLIQLLYSSAFVLAAEVLRWQCVGVLFRVAVGPLLYVLMAHGHAKAILATELCSNLLLLLAFWGLHSMAGLHGAAVALAIAGAPTLLLAYVLVRGATGFRPSRLAITLVVTSTVAMIALVLGMALLPRTAAFTLGMILCISLTAVHLRLLTRMADVPLLRPLLRRLARSRLDATGQRVPGP